jgi:hypothetical protein
VYGAVYTDGLDTTPIAQTMGEKLTTTGFASSTFKNVSASSAGSRLKSDRVFFFAGHANYDAVAALVFQESGGDSQSNAGGIAASSVSGLDLSRLQTAVLLACLVGKNLDAPDNLMTAFHNRGAQSVIGFKSLVAMSSRVPFGPEPWGKVWADHFGQYALEEHMELGDAARKAANDVSWNPISWVGFAVGEPGPVPGVPVYLEAGLPKDNLVVLYAPGKENAVYLKPDSGATGPAEETTTMVAPEETTTEVAG